MKKQKRLQQAESKYPQLKLDPKTEVKPLEELLSLDWHKYGPHHSIHESWALLFEEVDELWDIVRLKRKKRKADHIREELLQIAATALKAFRCVDDFVGPKKTSWKHERG